MWLCAAKKGGNRCLLGAGSRAPLRLRRSWRLRCLCCGAWLRRAGASPLHPAKGFALDPFSLRRKGVNRWLLGAGSRAPLRLRRSWRLRCLCCGAWFRRAGPRPCTPPRASPLTLSAAAKGGGNCIPLSALPYGNSVIRPAGVSYPAPITSPSTVFVYAINASSSGTYVLYPVCWFA